MITLAEAMLHLRVDEDLVTVEIEAMMATAKAHIENYLERTFPEGEEVPAPVKSAALLLVGDLYENREAQGEAAFYSNRTYQQLLNPYRLMVL